MYNNIGYDETRRARRHERDNNAYVAAGINGLSVNQSSNQSINLIIGFKHSNFKFSKIAALQVQAQRVTTMSDNQWPTHWSLCIVIITH